MEAFNAYFAGKQLPSGSRVLLVWRHPATLDVLTSPPGPDAEDLSQAGAGAGCGLGRPSGCGPLPGIHSSEGGTPCSHYPRRLAPAAVR